MRSGTGCARPVTEKRNTVKTYQTSLFLNLKREVVILTKSITHSILSAFSNVGVLQPSLPLPRIVNLRDTIVSVLQEGEEFLVMLYGFVFLLRSNIL